MTTPLFPLNDAPITIRQGKGGDCYLLAALDCILNSGPEGYAAIKSLFKETEDGIEVRIKRTDQSELLQTDKLQGKYIYHYDQVKEQDVFFIDKKRIEEIDETHGGVKSNSLAIKILEHLSPYYYASDWDQKRLLASVAAHNIKKRHNETSTAFVGKLLGIHTHDSSHIHKIIRLKTIAPQEPIYISMNYKKVDSHGKKHRRHALRIDKIVPNADSPGGYDFVLINPWDNQKRETYNLNDIQQRHSRFCTFNVNRYQHQLIKSLLTLPEDIGKKIFAHPELHQMLLAMRKVHDHSLNAKTIEHCITLYEQMNTITELFASLSIDEQKAMLLCIAKHTKQKEFLGALLTTVPRAAPHVFQLVIHQAVHENALQLGINAEDAKQNIEDGLKSYLYTDNVDSVTNAGNLRSYFIDGIFNKTLIANIITAQKVINDCIQQILAFPISFKECTSLKQVFVMRSGLNEHLYQLILNSKQLQQAEYTLGVPQHPQIILDAKLKKIQELHDRARERIKELKKEKINRAPNEGLGLFKAAPPKELPSLFPSPQTWGEGAQRADEGVLVRSSSSMFAPKGWGAQDVIPESEATKVEFKTYT